MKTSAENADFFESWLNMVFAIFVNPSFLDDFSAPFPKKIEEEEEEEETSINRNRSVGAGKPS
jgi:hypothetical protein